MLETQESLLSEVTEDSNLNKLEDFEKLEKEEVLLIQEREELIEAEQQLWDRISGLVQNKRQRNKELKEEVEQLRRKCEGLTEVLNRSIMSQLRTEK